MKVLLVEDEKLAADRLEKLIRRLEPQADIVGRATSVQSACDWLEQHGAPELAFLDIQLGDGLSFEIFERCPLQCPVIFTTAYDAYALKAFKLNSIDYLLKPIEEEELEGAFKKFHQWQGSRAANSTAALPLPDPMALERTRLQLSRQYKQRFLIRLGEQLHAIPVEEILYFWNEEKATFLTTTAGRRYLVDYSLNQLEELLDPALFFRINRQQMLRLESIKNIIAYSGSRLKVVLQYAETKEALVSRERVNEFKAWLDR
ncbi:LytR/AlgR family response regulator transcription factor [Cesiribacter andamanensis]|uniref:Sensory transduction protein lytR n=1 Tax=Cesiribacter andamanensis AMV16 TaxID=1279009 RepID=M7N8S8_9BACT|nr:LytTR family DNA-binding domain-containing protein [Cesiribacter andamanensis]EMR03616.1 Sensory transduction protein lytR [Cesiribacter andamanensis AMV16]